MIIELKKIKVEGKDFLKSWVEILDRAILALNLDDISNKTELGFRLSGDVKSINIPLIKNSLKLVVDIINNRFINSEESIDLDFFELMIDQLEMVDKILIRINEFLNELKKVDKDISTLDFGIVKNRLNRAKEYIKSVLISISFIYKFSKREGK